MQNMTSVEVGVTDKIFCPCENFWGNGSKGSCAAANTQKLFFWWVARGKRAVALCCRKQGIKLWGCSDALEEIGSRLLLGELLPKIN